MKGLKVSLVIMAGAVLTLGLSGMAYAFHSGGVAECEGCHSMHSPMASGTKLLIARDSSSTCLDCHESDTDTGPNGYHVSTIQSTIDAGTPPQQRTPGGDFGWIRKSFSWTQGSVNNTEDGAAHGHNIVAIDKGYTADNRTGYTTAPGGTMLSSQLSCISCHDPHGQYRRKSTGEVVTGATIGQVAEPIIGSGSYDNSTEPTVGKAVGVYRILGGASYTRGGASFTGVPAAKAPATYNRVESTTQTRVAYGFKEDQGHVSWGNWCGSCHGDFHSSGNYVHPVDESLSDAVVANYNAYKMTGDMTGLSSTSFLSLVPFTEGTGDYATLALHAKNNDSILNGPTATDKVDCLSCHRAHASGWLHALRWDPGYEFLTYNGAYVSMDNASMTSTRKPTQTRGRREIDVIASYYNRDATKFATYQRSLCNKCHAKD